MPLLRSFRFSSVAALAGTLTFSTAPRVDPLMGPGVSHQLASDRARQLSAIRYDMRLALDAPDLAHGSIAVRFTAAKAGDVVLDFRGPSLANVQVNGASAKTVFNNAHLRVPASAIHRGNNVITADFTTPIAAAGA